MQRKKTVSAYCTSKQTLPFAFARQRTCRGTTFNIIKIEWQLPRKPFADDIYTWVLKLLYILFRCGEGREVLRSAGLPPRCPCQGPICLIIGFTLALVNEFCRFLSQFSTNFHEILHTLFSIHVVKFREVLISI